MQKMIKGLINQHEDIFSGTPWYGDGVLEKLDKLDSKVVGITPLGELHSVIQLLQHMTAWKKYLIERMNGNANYEIVADSEIEWPSQSSTETWEEVVQELKEVHKIMIGDLNQKTDDWLSTINPGTDYTFHALVQGVIHHVVYHIGQIGLIVKLIALDSQNSRK